MPIVLFVLVLIAVPISLVFCWGKPARQRVTLIFWLGFSTVVCLSPSIWAVYWHIRHGNRVEFEGQTIRIPLRWTAEIISTRGIREVELSRYPATVFSRNADATARFGDSKYSVLEKSDDAVNQWHSLFWMEHAANDGTVVSGPKKVSAQTICMRAEGAQITELSCLLFGPHWSAEFSGGKTEVNSFLDVLRKIR